MHNYADITFILDRSGSMGSLVSDVVGGYKAFVDEQKRVGDNAVFSLVEFDHEYTPVFTAMPIAHVSSQLHFVPRGSTALRDAVGRTISGIESRLSLLPWAERPNKVIVVIMTDGEENASHEFTQVQIKSMIERLCGANHWEFLFLGANVDSFANAQSYGIPIWSTTNYVHDTHGTIGAFNSVSSYTACLRSSGASARSLSDLQIDNDTRSLSGTITSTPCVLNVTSGSKKL